MPMIYVTDQTCTKRKFRPEYVSIEEGNTIEIEWAQMHDLTVCLHSIPIRVKADFKVVEIHMARDIYTDDITKIVTVEPDKRTLRIVE